MKATEITLNGLLAGPNQYLIPVFQRYYSWTAENWQNLWEDLIELRELDQDGRTHFMGALVFVAEQNIPGKVPAFQVIDGQQRMITMSLLLCALRDVAVSKNYDTLARQVTETVLTHPFQKGQQHFRVFPRQRDREQYIAAVKREIPITGSIGDGLRFFTKSISELQSITTEDELGDFFNFLVSRLEFVTITLQGENPYRIFRSLNSTGVDLGEGDLIRNFVFMHVPSAEQDAFDDERWKPLEQYFLGSDGKLNSYQFSAFFRDFMMSAGKYIPPASTFQEFENYYGNQSFAPTQLAADLKLQAKLYNIIRGVDGHSNPNVQTNLVQLRRLESSTTYPLLLNLMIKVHRGEMKEADLAQAIALLSGFILRRFVCGDSSRAYGRWFVSACAAIGTSPLADIRTFLVSKGFPDDGRFQTRFIRANLYNSRYSRPVLEALERAQGHKEPAGLADATIEHIMPQTLTNTWKADLGADAGRVYSEWLHTVGNLTLSAYNPDMQNKPFSEKKTEYAKSNIVITRALASDGMSVWNEQTIMARAERLARQATTIWIGPDA